MLSEAGAGAGGHDAHAVYSPAVLAALTWACGVRRFGAVPQEQACGLLVTLDDLPGVAHEPLPTSGV